ncbi:hypothetical protein ACJRO7_014466 [Eucalyptus globulus]|uniref:Uncharacterized protein n=1 Tax=Eucalyptus globulus TaxID=34317 RepID=A0ABD3L0A6_EUCGL
MPSRIALGEQRMESGSPAATCRGGRHKHPWLAKDRVVGQPPLIVLVHQEELVHEDAIKEHHLHILVGVREDQLIVALPEPLLLGFDPLNVVLKAALLVVMEGASQVSQLLIFHWLKAFLVR